MAETPAPHCWDGMELGSRAAPSVGRTFGCAASNLFWGGGGLEFFLGFVGFGGFFKYHYSFPGLFPKVQPGKKMELEGWRGAFWISACRRQLPCRGRPEAPIVFPSFLRGLWGSPSTCAGPARLGLLAPWGHLPHEAMATGQWGCGRRWQECPHQSRT